MTHRSHRGELARKRFWDQTADRFGRDRLAVVTGPTARGISNMIVDFFQNRALSPLLAALSGKLVLEVGCGTGRWLARGRRKGARMIGIDISANMLRLARAHSLRAKFDLISAHASFLPFKSDTFDCILSVTTLQHVLDPKRLTEVASEIRRTLRPDGLLILLETATSLHVDEKVTEDYPTAFRSVHDWQRLFRNQKVSLVTTRPVNPSLGAEFIKTIAKDKVKGSGYYARQLEGQLEGIDRLLKVAWDVSRNLLSIISFPIDFMFMNKLCRFSVHKIMIFRND